MKNSLILPTAAFANFLTLAKALGPLPPGTDFGPWQPPVPPSMGAAATTTGGSVASRRASMAPQMRSRCRSSADTSRGLARAVALAADTTVWRLHVDGSPVRWTSAQTARVTYVLYWHIFDGS